jgi:transcriptional regulator with XRE-family HTH domain
MGAVGERLRRERLKTGLDLDRVSQETKIPARYLEAMEQEQYEKLPGRVFLFSFLRQYAHALGLDELELMAQLRAEQEPPPPAPVPEPPRPRHRRTQARVLLPGAAVLVFAFILVGTRPWTRSAPPVPPARRGASVVSSGSADRLVLSVPEQPPPKPVAPAGWRLVLVAKQRTWVTAKQDGRSAFVGRLQPNESRVLEGGETIDLVIGNPEAVELSLNGKPIEIAGPRGALAEVRIAARDAPPVISHRRPLADLY